MLGFVTLSACGLDSAYACTSDAQCSNGQGAGRCEFDGYCSFDDDTCASGRRYGKWAPAAVARVCVDSSAAPTSTAGSSTDPPPSADTSTTLDASSTSTSTSTPTADATTLAVTQGPTGDSSSGSLEGDGSDSSSSGSIDVLDPDLIAWYRFDDIEGGSVLDSSGNGHVATCEECPDAVEGVYGGAVETDGAGQHLVVANAPAFAMETWTLAAWVWSQSPPSTFVTVFGKPVGVGIHNSYELGMRSSGMDTVVSVGWSDDLESQGLTVTLPASQQWFHVAATLSDTTATLYLDGEIANETALTVIPAFDGNDLYIGADVDDLVLENFFFGRIDDLRIYRRALTVEEVAAVMVGESL